MFSKRNKSKQDSTVKAGTGAKQAQAGSAQSLQVNQAQGQVQSQAKGEHSQKVKTQAEIDKDIQMYNELIQKHLAFFKSELYEAINDTRRRGQTFLEENLNVPYLLCSATDVNNYFLYHWSSFDEFTAPRVRCKAITIDENGFSTHSEEIYTSLESLLSKEFNLGSIEDERKKFNDISEMDRQIQNHPSYLKEDVSREQILENLQELDVFIVVKDKPHIPRMPRYKIYFMGENGKKHSKDLYVLAGDQIVLQKFYGPNGCYNPTFKTLPQMFNFIQDSTFTTEFSTRPGRFGAKLKMNRNVPQLPAPVYKKIILPEVKPTPLLFGSAAQASSGSSVSSFASALASTFEFASASASEGAIEPASTSVPSFMSAPADAIESASAAASSPALEVFSAAAMESSSSVSRSPKSPQPVSACLITSSESTSASATLSDSLRPRKTQKG